MISMAMTNSRTLVEDQWEVVRQYLPFQLDEHARQHDAMRRKRGQITSAEQLLRVLLMHIAGGLSLEQTVARARLRRLADLNAMALHKRLCTSGPWLSALTAHLLTGIKPLLGQNDAPLLEGRRFRILDATTVSEPGSTGTDWRLHYSLRLPDLCCDFLELTDPKGGESVRRMDVNKGDVILLDRAYNDRQAIAGVIDAGAAVILRYNSGAFPLIDRKGRKIDLLAKFRKLRIGQTAQLSAWFQDRTRRRLPIRVCVLRKSPEAAQRAERKMRSKARGKASRIRPETLEYAHYLIVMTNLPPEDLSVANVLEFYRARWQVELAFKRLKTLLELGQLPKKKEASSLAWMQGKILCAILIERLLCEARFISPWGYPVGRTEPVELV